MTRSPWIRYVVVVLITVTACTIVQAQSQQEEFKNLKVLPKGIQRDSLIAIMGGFTRALGVRCNYCHVGEEGKPLRPEDFQLDDKATKRKAREMLRMVSAINDTLLTRLEDHASPPARVQCVTCHRGAPVPRMLEDVLKSSYDQGGLDSTLTRYGSLRDRYYGRFTYDFGETPLTVVAARIRAQHPDDAIQLLELNVQQNPKSSFAKRQHAAAVLTQSFRAAGSDSGAAAYARLKSDYGPAVVSENLMNDVAAQLVNDHPDQAIAALKLSVADHPTSADAYAGLGDAYARRRDWKLATEAYRKALELDPGNETTQQKLDQIKVQSKKKKTK